jgi:hypothetical protein
VGKSAALSFLGTASGNDPVSAENFGIAPFADPEESAAEKRSETKTDGGKTSASAAGILLVGFAVFALAALSASFLLIAAAIRPH